MWYLITAGAGLLLGLGLMTWALTERASRHKAERVADEARHREDAMSALLSRAETTVKSQATELTRARVQTETLRAALEELRKRLVECKDPDTIRAWLDEELKEGPL